MANSRWATPFTPRSQIGESMGNIMTALFAGKGGGASGGSNRSPAQDEADLAQAFKFMAEGDLDRQTYDARSGVVGRADELLRQRENSRVRPLNLDFAPGDDGLGFDLDTSALARLIRPESDEPIVRPYLPNSGEDAFSRITTMNGPVPAPSFAAGGEPRGWAVPSAVTRLEQPGFDLDALPPGLGLPDAMPEVVMSRGAPGPVDPLEQERYNTLLAIELARAFGGNPDQIVGGIGGLQTQGFERGLMSGAVTPEQWFLLNNKPLQDVQDGYAVPTTSMAEPNPLGTALARIATEESRAREIDSRIPLNEARVATEGARQNLMGEQAATQPSVRDRNAAAAERSRRPGSTADGKPLVPKKFDVQTIEGEIATLLQDATGETNIDAGLLNSIKARAMELFAESGDHFDAAARAVEEVAAGIEVEGNWNPFKTNKIVPKPGLGPRRTEPAVTTSPGMRAPAAPSFPPAPVDKAQRKPGAVYMTPKGPMTWTGTGWLPPA
jgi:hypothetical protein